MGLSYWGLGVKPEFSLTSLLSQIIKSNIKFYTGATVIRLEQKKNWSEA